MKNILVLLLLSLNIFVNAQSTNLLQSDDFKTLDGWKSNEGLTKNGKLTLIPEDNSVLIFNPQIDTDGYIFKTIPTNGQKWFSYAATIKSTPKLIRAALCFVALDKNGKELTTIPTAAISYPKTWKTYQGNFKTPPNTTEIKVILAALDGGIYVTKISLQAIDEPIKKVVKPSVVLGNKGFTVSEFSTDRPFWEMFSDDLDKDGVPEIIACDVDGIVTVRHEGMPPFMTYAPGALVYQFAAADLNNDGVKEILMSSVDPKIAVKAIDLKGNTVVTFNESKGHERIAVGDMTGDGNLVIAISKDNVKTGSGVSSGIIVYSATGKKLWEKNEVIKEFQFGDVLPSNGNELICVGKFGEFSVKNSTGEVLDAYKIATIDIDHFLVADIDNDGVNEIVASTLKNLESEVGNSLVCIKSKQILWSSPVDIGECLLSVGDFDPSVNGLEVATVGVHSQYLFDAQGGLMYQNIQGKLNDKKREYWEGFVPDGINTLDIASWGVKNPNLFLSSSRYRHSAYYKLTFGDKDELHTYEVPDQEQHLEKIYADLKKQPVLPTSTKEKVKMFLAIPNLGKVSEAELMGWKAQMNSLETPNMEYLMMYEASDLKGHERGVKMTIDEIVERAKLLEKVGIPFGYFATHGGQPMISGEAIEKTKVAAPTMFRFVYMAENLETLYSVNYKDVLQWTKKTIEFCAARNMKMIFKEKHDVWGLIPADAEVRDILFNPKYKGVTVPIWATNQVYQPEVQYGGMLGLKQSGLCTEFGMSTQYWNWHEWGAYPRGIRDISATRICPSDIMLRLELTGLALGATWIHIEGSQPYFMTDISKGIAPMVNRHRDLAYELVRKNILTPGAAPVNLSKTTLLRSMHPQMEKAKNENLRVMAPYYTRNSVEELRKGFIPARYLFESYSATAFPMVAYASATNGITCFPQTPNGWISILPSSTKNVQFPYVINTDGEKVMVNKEWQSDTQSANYVQDLIKKGGEDFPIEAPGTCLIIQKDNSKENSFFAIAIDPGYLAPKGINTSIKTLKQKILTATDMITGESLKFSGNVCPIQIEPGAFRVIRLELGK